MVRDIRLVFRNAYAYNQKSTDTWTMAERLSKQFEEKLDALGDFGAAGTVTFPSAVLPKGGSGRTKVKAPVNEALLPISKRSWHRTCVKLLKLLSGHQYGHVFLKDVDPIKLGIPHYTQVIKNPCSFQTIRKRLMEKADQSQCVYQEPAQFIADVRLVRPKPELFVRL